jgi:DNA-binding NarL/FixJ family response regulator
MSLDKRFRIVIASSSRLFLEGVSKILKSQEEIQIVGAISNLDEIEDCLNEAKPEFLLLDNRTSNLDARNLSNSIKNTNPEIKVILLRYHPGDEFKSTNIININKETNSAELIEIIKTSRNGTTVKKLTGINRAKSKVTKREVRVLELLERGLSNREIADILQIREKTVKAHVTSIFTKLGFQRRYQLILYGHQLRPKAKLKA